MKKNLYIIMAKPVSFLGYDTQDIISVSHSISFKHTVSKLHSDIFNAWHQYRVPILSLVIISCYLTLTFVSWRNDYKKRSHTSRLTIFQAPAVVPARRDWLEEESSTKSTDEHGNVLLKESASSKTKASQQNPQRRPQSGPKRLTGSRLEKRLKKELDSRSLSKLQPLVFYSSLTGTTENYTRILLNDIKAFTVEGRSNVLEPQIHDLSYLDYDDYFIATPKSHHKLDNVCYFYLIVLPSYNIDSTLDKFLNHLQETHHDFRVDTAPLSGLAGYSVFGFGDREGWNTETDGFCFQAIEVDKWMAKLTGRKRAFPLGLGDVKSDAHERLEEWRDGVVKTMLDVAAQGDLGEGVTGSGNAVESDDEDIEESSTTNDLKSNKKRKVGLGDLEDLGRKTDPGPIDGSFQKASSPIPIDFTPSRNTPQALHIPKPMVPVSSPTHSALTKQGYTIIGSHSGVKICRWTKSALRGRGSCYKYSFYGIKSHLCMETTPSLSCSNKCVFCWRHGTNPVGTTWRWQVDPPQMIFDGAKEGHYKKIKMMRGVPGVRAERFQEAMRIRHCALSLVGEPIFYPHINEFIDLLHKERISSFLVCNAQHPDQLEALEPVTQLYVSIDASNAESLRKIDRPLHRDYWQRFMRCLDILREKRFRMRTVFRLTLVKGFNIDEEVEGYADLVARGLPCFVEIKGVTYCGTSSSAGAGLTMQNVPFYEEITTFVEAINAALQKRGLEYGIAAEHAHSCCVLIASSRFFVEGKWHTLIDYDRFFGCLEFGKTFSPEDYMGHSTPEWATWGNGGFDPADERVDRKGRPKAIFKDVTEVNED